MVSECIIVQYIFYSIGYYTINCNASCITYSMVYILYNIHYYTYSIHYYTYSIHYKLYNINV